jgi:DNA-binding response OmpR family regulator
VIESESPAAVLTDFDLGPGGDGVDLLARMRREGCQVPAIMMTGSDPTLARARLARAGLDEIALLVKPFAFDELMKMLGEVLPGGGSAAAAVRAPRPTPVAALVDKVVHSFRGRVL